MSRDRKWAALLLMALLWTAGAALAMPKAFGPWGPAARVEALPGTSAEFNGVNLDGCPFVSRDDKTFYMASNRPGGKGGIDIWVSTRAGVNDPWGAPVNVGEPVNSSFNDFCPTIARNGHTFFFVSNRPGGCGGGDIFTARLTPTGFKDVTNLGCEVNSAAEEASPFPLPQSATGPVLYFSSTRAGGSDIYMSEWQGSAYGAATLVPGVNTGAAEGHPNVRRDGLEIFFFSNRAGGQGGNDIWSASRASTNDPFGDPVNLGAGVNSAGPETRPSLSWDGTTLYFGSIRAGGEGDSDHYVTTRTLGG